MTTIASQITSLAVVYSTVYSDADKKKHQSSAPLAFVWGIHRDRWIPRTKGQLRGKCFHLMTSSWIMQTVVDPLMAVYFIANPYDYSYHYSDVIMTAMVSRITGVLIVYSTVFSAADHRKHQSSASLAFVRGIHRWPVNSLLSQLKWVRPSSCFNI